MTMLCDKLLIKHTFKKNLRISEWLSGSTKVSKVTSASFILFKGVRPITHLFHYHKSFGISIIAISMHLAGGGLGEREKKR